MCRKIYGVIWYDLNNLTLIRIAIEVTDIRILIYMNSKSLKVNVYTFLIQVW